VAIGTLTDGRVVAYVPTMCGGREPLTAIDFSRPGAPEVIGVAAGLGGDIRLALTESVLFGMGGDVGLYGGAVLAIEVSETTDLYLPATLRLASPTR
jgi:hypothetical protein